MNIEERIIKLEQSNKRLKIGMSIMGILLISGLLMGATVGNRDDEIVAKSLRLVGEGSANTIINAGGMFIYNKNSKGVVSLRAANDKGYLELSNNEGLEQIMLTILDNENGGVIKLFNKTGDEIVQLLVDEYGNGFIGVWDRKGKGRTLTPQ